MSTAVVIPVSFAGAAEQQFQMVANTMRAHFIVSRTRKITLARTCEQFYGFRPEDVAGIYFYKH